MTNNELRSHIYLTLANLYENPLHRNQYKRFTFNPEDEQRAQKIISELLQYSIVEQIQPEVIRLTSIGYNLIKRDLNRLRAENTNESTLSKAYDSALKPPTNEEIISISSNLANPDYVSSSRFVNGRSEIFWATEGFEKITGYTLKELNKAGGSIALVPDTQKLEQIFILVLNGKEVRDEVEIITKNGSRRRIQFILRPRYDSAGLIAGILSAIKLK